MDWAPIYDVAVKQLQYGDGQATATVDCYVQTVVAADPPKGSAVIHFNPVIYCICATVLLIVTSRSQQ